MLRHRPAKGRRRFISGIVLRDNLSEVTARRRGQSPLAAFRARRKT